MRRGDDDLAAAEAHLVSHAQQGLDHQHQHGAFQAEEKPGHERQMPQGDEGQRQAQHDQRPGQDEEQPRHQPAHNAMHQPAEISGKLLRLRPRQQRAEIERVQKAPLAHPFQLVDDDPVHEGDLPSRPAEG